MKHPLVLAAIVPALLAGCSDDPGNPCFNPPPGVGSVVITARAADDPCAGQGKDRIVAWFQQGGARYLAALRSAGRRAGPRWVRPRAYPLRLDAAGHHRAPRRRNDPAFAAEITATLAHGQEGHAGGGNRRYTLEYPATKASCSKSWGFRVVLAKQPSLQDGHPTGIITALRYINPPAANP